MEFAVGEQLSTKCFFLPQPFLFSLAPGPQATMDVYLDTLGGQESASNSSKGSSRIGNKQGYYPCVKNNSQGAMLNSLFGGGLFPCH